jgi:polyketide synthase 12
LRAYLSERLPEYMVPWAFVVVDHWPLTANGKLDKNALPDPRVPAAAASARPTNQTQRELVEIWAGVLGVTPEAIGVHTNFYDAGGNSLKMIRMTSRVNKHFNAKVSMAKMFELSAIASIAEFLDRKEGGQPAEATSGPDDGLAQLNEALGIIRNLQD